MMSTFNDPPFAELFNDVLQEAIEQGFTAPITVVAISADGVVTCIRCEEDGDHPGKLEPKIVSDYAPSDSEMMALPLNVFLVDAHGEAKRMVVTAQERRWVH